MLYPILRRNFTGPNTPAILSFSPFYNSADTTQYYTQVKEVLSTNIGAQILWSLSNTAAVSPYPKNQPFAVPGLITNVFPTCNHYSSTLLDDLDFTPASDHWSLPPQSSIDPLQNENQALITIEYNKIDPKLSDEFEQNVRELGHLLRSEGMAYWELFQDPADTGHYIEIRIADTWTDHIRQHEYVTKNVQVMENRIRELIKDCPQPIISHYIRKSPLK